MKLILFTILLAFNTALFAQNKLEINQENSTKTIQGLVNQTLELISGDTTKIRDWDAFRNLFLPTAQFTIVDHNKKNPKKVQVVNLEEFVRLVKGSYQNSGFQEHQIEMRYDEYNGIAQVFQTYFAKSNTSGYKEKGVNSYQLVFTKKRWWITSLVWTSDFNGVEIPKLNP